MDLCKNIPWICWRVHCNGFLPCPKKNWNLAKLTCDSVYKNNPKQTPTNQVLSAAPCNFIVLGSSMKCVPDDKLNDVLSLIDRGNSARCIAKITGLNTSTVARYWTLHHPNVPKSSGSHPSKLSPSNVHHAVRLISTGQAENATQVARSLQTITNNSKIGRASCRERV